MVGGDYSIRDTKIGQKKLLAQDGKETDMVAEHSY